ncbi:MAG: hypothetical protein ACRDDM_12115 [Paraclostridium sp.]
MYSLIDRHIEIKIEMDPNDMKFQKYIIHNKREIKIAPYNKLFTKLLADDEIDWAVNGTFNTS